VHVLRHSPRTGGAAREDFSGSASLAGEPTARRARTVRPDRRPSTRASDEARAILRDLGWEGWNPGRADDARHPDRRIRQLFLVREIVGPRAPTSRDVMTPRAI